MNKPHENSVDWSQWFSYDSNTGWLVWKNPGYNKKRLIGKVACRKTNRGYREVRVVIDGVRRAYFAHRVVAAMHGLAIGDDQQVDHANGDTQDNRIFNLRVVSRSVNLHNCASVCGKTSRFLGVSANQPGNGRPWCAFIRRDWKLKRLGSFDSEEDAARAYDQAKAGLLIDNGEDPADFARAFNFPEEVLCASA